MTTSHPALSRLSDRQLMECLHAVVGRDRRLTAELLAHLGEVDVRDLCAREAEGSLYMYCVKVLRFSEGCAYKRIAAARAARKYPMVLDMVARGDLHVSAINMLVPHLSSDNHRDLLTAATRKSKREIAELIAERFPRPDAKTSLRKLPERRGEVRSAQLASTRAPPVAPSVPSLLASDAQGTMASAIGAASASVASGAARVQSEPLSPATLVLSSAVAAAPTPMSSAFGPAPAQAAARPQDRASVQPLSPGRYRLQLTLSRQGRDDLLHAQELMRHQQPDGDLTVVVERALSLLVEELERRKFGRLKVRGKRGSSASSATADATEAATRAVTKSDVSRAAPEPPPQRLDGGEQREARSPSRVDAAALQREFQLAPGAKALGRQWHAQLDPEANDGGDPPLAQLDPGANDTRDQPLAQLDPGANDTRDQPHAQLDPGANDSGDQPLAQLDPGANDTRDQPLAQLDPGASDSAPAGPSRRSCHDDRRRDGPNVKSPSRDLPRAVRRAVVQRDGMQCTYVGPDGRRCEAREFLEFHHIVPVARGGRSTVANVCLRCRIHHGLQTARDFGAEAVLRHKKGHRP